MRFPTTPGVNLCALHRPSVSQRVLLTAAASRGSEGAARDERARNDRRAHSSHVSFLHTHTPHTKSRPLHTRPPCARGRRARSRGRSRSCSVCRPERGEARRDERAAPAAHAPPNLRTAPHRTAPHRTAPHRLERTCSLVRRPMVSADRLVPSPRSSRRRLPAPLQPRERLPPRTALRPLLRC